MERSRARESGKRRRGHRREDLSQREGKKKKLSDSGLASISVAPERREGGGGRISDLLFSPSDASRHIADHPVPPFLPLFLPMLLAAFGMQKTTEEEEEEDLSSTRGGERYNAQTPQGKLRGMGPRCHLWHLLSSLSRPCRQGTLKKPCQDFSAIFLRNVLTAARSAISATENTYLSLRSTIKCTAHRRVEESFSSLSL